MNPISLETLGIMLIFAYVFMCSIFLMHQKRGKSFVDSFDKAFMWGSAIFVIGYGLDTVTYATMV